VKLQIKNLKRNEKARGSGFGSGTALQTGRSRLRFPMGLEIFQLTYSIQPGYCPGIISVPNRNE
jgi:hypothetical protein